MKYLENIALGVGRLIGIGIVSCLVATVLLLCHIPWFSGFGGSFATILILGAGTAHTGYANK